MSRKSRTKSADGRNVIEVGRAEPGAKEFLEARTTTNPRSIADYAGHIGMIRLRTPRPLLELSGDEARKLAAELKDTKSRHILCSIARMFFGFHERPDLAKMFKSKAKRSTIKRDDIPTDDEVAHVISNTKYARDQALMGALFECGVRISELLAVRLKDHEVIESPQNGGRKLVKIWFRKSKNEGEQHWFTLVDSAPLVAEWVSRYPLPRKGGDAPLFPSNARNNYGGFLDRSAVSRLMKELGKAAGADPKKFHPHAARHYAATRLLRKGMTDAQVKKSLGWMPNSNMLGRYSHLVDQDTQDAYLRASGLEVGPTARPADFPSPIAGLPPMPAPPERVVDLDDPQFQKYLDAWIVKRMELMRKTFDPSGENEAFTRDVLAAEAKERRAAERTEGNQRRKAAAAGRTRVPPAPRSAPR